MTNAMTSDFLSLISNGWVLTFQDSHRTVLTFRSWLDLLGVVLAFWISTLKFSKLLQSYWHRVIDITSFEKRLECSLDHTLNFSCLQGSVGVHRGVLLLVPQWQCISSFVFYISVEIWWYFFPRIFVKRNLSPGLLRWSSLQTKEGQRHNDFHLVGFENSQTPSTTVLPSDHREDYMSCAWSFYSLVQTFPKALHSD